MFEWDGQTVTTLNLLYTISGTPRPALMAPLGPLSAEQELRELMSRLPPKSRQ